MTKRKIESEIVTLSKLGTEAIRSLSALELGRAIREGRTTAIDATDAVLEQIRAVDADYRCFITVAAEQARSRAQEVQAQIERGALAGPLAGVPVALKDNICTRGIRTTCASKMLADFVPAYSAEAAKRLEAAGAILIGKTNMDEFAFGSTTETSYFGTTCNPYSPKHCPGGSSGGSAAAVALQECFFALGSDTGGSVRQPASHCGVVGMKPSYGMVSRYGLVAYASSMDQIGPMTKNVEDCAAVLEILCGRDAKDATCVCPTDTDFRTALIRDVRGMRIGVPREYLEAAIDDEVRDAILQAASQLEQEGAVVEPFTLGLTEYAVPTYYTIASAEAGSNLERFDGIRYGHRAQEESLQKLYTVSRSEGFGTEVRRRILLGTFVLSAGYYDAYYLKAQKVRNRLVQTFDKAFAAYDLILSPVAPTAAPVLGRSPENPVERYLEDVYTICANLCGLPAISVPCGETKQGLPIGLQLMGSRFREKTVLQAAFTYEQTRKEKLYGSK